MPEATVSTTTAPPPDATTAGAPVLVDTFIPQDLRDRAYLKPWMGKPWSPELAGEVFKKLDGAETLIGKRPSGIPSADAPEKEWEDFYGKLRPGKADDYEIKLGDAADPEFVKTLQTAFYDAGATKGQASKIITKLAVAIEAQNAAQAEAAKARDAEFDKLTAETFGAANAAKLEQAKAMIAEHCPPNLKAYADKLDNAGLVILAGVLNNVREAYGLEDQIGKNGGKGAGGSDVAALREEARTLMANPAYADAFHADHEKTKGRVDAIYAQIGGKK